MSMSKLDPKFSYEDVVKFGQVYYTQRGQKTTAKVTIMSARLAVVEYSNVDGAFICSETFRPNYGMSVRELRDSVARYSRQNSTGLSFWVENDDQATEINNLRAANQNLTSAVTTLEGKVTSLIQAQKKTGAAKLMLTVGNRDISNYKSFYAVGDSFVLLESMHKPVAFINVSHKQSVVIYDADGRYVKTCQGLRTAGGIREALKEAGFDGLLHFRKDSYAEAYRENAIALLNGTAVPHNQLTQQAATETAPAVLQQQGGKFILWAPDSTVPPRVIMEGRNQANSIADQMHARHGKTFYVAQLVRKVETVKKVVTTTEKKVTDLV